MYRYSAKIILLLFLSTLIYAQHRGDELTFQGITAESNNGIKAKALSGAFTAYNGDLGAIFYNPAGLAGIDKFQISFSGNAYKKTWQESQSYRPNRQYTTMSFILDGLYVPNPEYSGYWDNQAFFADTNYIINDPELGVDPYDDGADWKEERANTTLNNISVAFPFELFETKFTVAAAYSRKFDINDFDRNETYLDPHVGSNAYGGIPLKVASVADSLQVNWYDYSRSRKGDLNSYSFALSADINKYLNLGVTVNILDGKSEDYLTLNKIAYFTLAGQNVYRFTYDALPNVSEGSSTFSGVNLNLGALIKLDNLDFGISVSPSYTIKREWTLNNLTQEFGEEKQSADTGEDELEVPASYTIGVRFRPVDNFSVSADYGKIAYSKANFNLSGIDSLQHSWVDQTALRFGMEYSPVQNLNLMGGYKYVTEYFVPDGAANKETGPAFSGFSFGTSYKIYMVELFAAYEYSLMKYDDIYFSNTNYNKETFSNIYFGTTISL